MPSDDEFEIVRVKRNSDDPYDYDIVEDGSDNFDGFRKVHKISRLQYGTYFQAACRSPEWKAVSIIINKYKRKMEISSEEALGLKLHIESFSAERKAQGKKCSDDFLVQEVSSYLKRLQESKNLTKTEEPDKLREIY